MTKSKTVEYGEYTVKQSTNNHVAVYKNGRMVMHCQCDKPMTDDELLSYIGFYEVFANKGGAE